MNHSSSKPDLTVFSNVKSPLSTPIDASAPRRAPPGGWGAHEGLIAQVAARYWRAYGGRGRTPGDVEWDDLMQAGRMGMLRAAETWDPARGAWSTYATPWIRHAIARECQNKSRTVRLPVHLQESLHKRGELKFERAIRVQLDAPANDNNGRPLHERIADPDWEHPDEQIGAEQDHAAVRAAIEQLPERLRDIVRRRFWREHTLKGIGGDYGLSRERIRQLEATALDELSAILGRVA